MPMLDPSQIPALLESVKRKPPLYNFDPKRRACESKLRLQLWDEVGNELNASAELCKESWQSLRTKLRIFLTKREEDETAKWRWYDKMEFFIPHMNSFPSTRPRAMRVTPVPKKHWRHSLTEGLKKYKNSAGSKLGEKRKSMPAYAAKSTSQVPSWMTPVSSLPAKSYPGIIEKHSSFSPPTIAFRPQSQQGETTPVFREPSSSLPSQDEDNSTSILSAERKTLEDYREYHFVCCVMEMLEEVPPSKRNMVKARIMAEIGSAYQ